MPEQRSGGRAPNIKVLVVGTRTDVLSGVLSGALGLERDIAPLGPVLASQIEASLAEPEPPRVVLLIEDAAGDAEAASVLDRHPEVALLRVSTVDGDVVARLRRPGIAQLAAIVRAVGAPTGGRRGEGARRPGVRRPRSAAGTGGRNSETSRQAGVPIVCAAGARVPRARHRRLPPPRRLRPAATPESADSACSRRGAALSVPALPGAPRSTVWRTTAHRPVHPCEDRPPWL